MRARSVVRTSLRVRRAKGDNMQEIIDVGDWAKEEEELMKRLNRIVSASDQGLFKKPNAGGSWQLDSSNDFWARIEDGKLVLSDRYSTERFKALVAFVKTWLAPIRVTK